MIFLVICRWVWSTLIGGCGLPLIFVSESWSLCYLILVHTVQLKPTIKVQISGRMASIGISDVVSASVYSEKTRMKKLMMMKMIIISIMNKSQELTVFHGRQKLTSAMKLRPKK